MTKIEGMGWMAGVMLNNDLLRALEDGHTEVEISKSLILLIELCHIAREVCMCFIEVVIESLAEVGALGSENGSCDKRSL